MIKVTFDNGSGQGDLDFDSGMVEDTTFETAITISLLTWRRCEKEDLPADLENLGGFWGDTFADVEGDRTGSKLWLLQGQKINNENLDLAKQYVEEALEWMIEDGIADKIDVKTSRGEYDQLEIELFIQKPNEPAPKWVGIWEVQLDG